MFTDNEEEGQEGSDIDEDRDNNEEGSEDMDDADADSNYRPQKMVKKKKKIDGECVKEPF